MPTTFEIHPAVGICRVGTGEGSFLGPEPGISPPSAYRDDEGNLLRQAARFRVFECERDDQGQLLHSAEIGPERGRVSWTVHIANRKGDSELSPPRPSLRAARGTRRNARHANRSDLVIDPGPRTLVGPGQAAAFDTGRFLGQDVDLGSATTDQDGRLVIVGGFGRSDGPAADLQHFSNNDNWFDDMSDGPVTASVQLTGRDTIDASPAWLIVAPPDFAPLITNLVTLHDIAFQAAIDRGWLTAPSVPSFTRHILPILNRAVGYRWVNQLALAAHGEGRRGDFTNPQRLARLADPAAPGALRRSVAERLRDPGDLAGPTDGGMMPRLHDVTNSDKVLTLTKWQFDFMQKWVAGSFVNDLGQDLPAEQLPDAIDRSALEACAGGPFFPGIEVGRIMSEPATYMSPFRVDSGSLGPGGLTGGNAVPWQADFLLCRFEEQVELGWWPAQRPDKVQVVGDPLVQRWQRGVESWLDMVAKWDRLGIVVPATDGTAAFVESERKLP